MEPDEASSSGMYDPLGLPVTEAAGPDGDLSLRRFTPAPPAFKRGGTGRIRMPGEDGLQSASAFAARPRGRRFA